MNEENLGELIRDMKKGYENDQNFDLASHLINYYYTHLYVGEELDKVTALYFDYLWLELTIWIGQNMSYLKQNKKGLKKANKFFDKEIIKGKINTYDTRIKIFHNWLGGEKNIEDNNMDMHKKDILNTLLKLYPAISSYNEVKKMLGLNETMEDLESKLKELKNAKV